MKVGIKFCGGCNPRYDRKAAYDKILSEADDTVEILKARDKEKYDWLIVLAGCPNACADCSGIVFEREKLVITEYIQVKDIIKRINEQDNQSL